MIAIGVILFTLLVVVHEFGHFLAARRAGVEVEEFGIGFPPRLYGRKWGNGQTLYSLNLIPLGGFVRLKGEEADSKVAGSFGAASYVSKMKIGFAGIAMNIVAAYFLVLLLCVFGLPNMIPNQFSITRDEQSKKAEVLIVDVAEDSAAAIAGLSRGVVIKTVDGQTITDAQQLVDFTKARPNQRVKIGYQEAGQVQVKEIQLGERDGKGVLGVVPFSNRSVKYTWSAPIVALVLTLQLTWLTVLGFFQLIVGLISNGTSAPEVAGVAGPISIFALLSSAGDLGFTYLLLLIISISISLAVINALPFPALDGGRMALITVFKIIKRPLTAKFEGIIHSAGFVLLIILAIVISVSDVKKLL